MRRSPASAPVGRLVSSDAIEAGGFTPGTVLAGRYRIIGLLGHGGMGEVYRADDLKLGQPVALKFLPRALAQDPSRLERFYAEVRIARQVSHPNVCRVYDVGEIEGQHYLSMEFVDGEDLASLLKRIGRLPADKALDISRELCAGLAAAHDKGVLHRDLKPANVMIDGRGRARITDFGLAVAAGEAVDGEVSGTPAYMAPEQLEGKGASVRSDIYALGLVLYELYTGRKAFEGASFQELKRKHSKEAPVTPSTVSPGFDPVVERVILRCLEKDPARRPASVPQVAAALPGGDPLAAALAAGETPSPEMVAAAGEEGALAPGRAWALLGAVAVTVLTVLLLVPFATDLGLAPLPKSPDVLFDRASEVARKLGYPAPAAADTASWWDRQYDMLRYRADHIPSPQRVRELATVEPHPWWFWYRQSPRPMVATNMDQVVRRDDPPLEIAGMVSLALDARGDLVRLRAVPPQIDESKGASPTPDWDALFHEAGLDPKRFAPSGPKWLPPAFADARAEWDGSFEHQPGVPIHVTAAAYRGKPVYFEVLGPWDKPLRMPDVREARRVARAAFMFLVLAVLAAGVIFARRNLRQGRGDPRGALRVSSFVVVLSILAWLLFAHHVTDLWGEFEMLIRALGFALFKGAFVWLAYMALEPYVRRKWPDLLISWTRLLSGRFQDPLVGRDVLIGLFFGGLTTIVFFIDNGLASFWNVPGMTPVPPGGGQALSGPSRLGGWLLDQVGISPILALAVTSLLILSWVILRRRWLAVGMAFLVLALMEISSENILVEVSMALAIAGLTIFTVVRFGIVALAVSILLRGLFSQFPLTLDFSRWYAGRSLFLLLVLAGLAFYGFRTCLGGKSALGAAALDEA
ncbi:MAG TPA: serine/threonine-protein kinase [Thermoanaerobaculia bacterium]|nr:serine/threonine-protein kinase [Thermoanaerobaculia bacterium]